MNTKSKLSVTLLCAASVLAISSAARAQTAAADTTETVVVTGSRVISDAANSPTPLTIVTTAQLLATTPGQISDALNKLPVFEGQTTTRSTNNQSVNSSGAALNLRNFGAQRTLVLLDGHRITPANVNGTVDTDTLPSMLIQRVDVVTGGASAVYGSDAVTGVVNYILDKRFDGLKVSANSGISNYSDAAEYTLGLAAGTDILKGRGHFEGSLRYFHQDGVLINQRYQGANQVWGFEGAGTAANPFNDFNNVGNILFGGRIVAPGTAANGMKLNDGGVLGPYNTGTATGSANISNNSDGGHTTIAQITSMLNTAESFARFSYNIDDTTTFYVQGSANESYTKGSFQNHEFASGTAPGAGGPTVPGTFYKNNPLIPAATAALLAGGTTSTFAFADYWDQGYERSGQQDNNHDRNLSVTTGLDGTAWGKYDWDLFYTHGQNRLDVNNPTNENQQKMYAGTDAVLNASGNVVCYVSTTVYASLYPGCVPANPFIKANAVNESYNQYISQDTQWIGTQILDDVGGSIAGDVFDLPAGPIKAALSGEMRWTSLSVQSNASPLAAVNCLGLRLCNSTTPLFQNNTVAALPTVGENVWEFAGEAGIPILKDLPFIQSLSADIAGRYTNYSTSGAVETWKIGLNYHVDDNLSFRATNSIDIRAPTLYDLYSPVQRGVQSFSDLLTQTTAQNQQSSQGNPALVPEVARTYTAGVVFTPTFLPGFQASVDYYQITLKNAISNVSGGNTSVQQICINSGGSSPFCGLAVRPFAPGTPQYTTAANFPTLILSQGLNTAFNRAQGLDMEADYRFEMSDLYDALPGSTTLRLLATLQPVNQTLQYTGAPLTFNPLSKGRVTGFVNYTLGNWTINVEDRWLSNWTRNTIFGQVYTNLRVPTRDYVDITIDKKFVMDDSTLDGYLSIQNIANVQPPVDPTNGSTPNLYYMGAQGAITTQYDAIGRYFTIGVRANL